MCDGLKVECRFFPRQTPHLHHLPPHNNLNAAAIQARFHKVSYRVRAKQMQLEAEATAGMKGLLKPQVYPTKTTDEVIRHSHIRTRLKGTTLPKLHSLGEALSCCTLYAVTLH